VIAQLRYLRNTGAPLSKILVRACGWFVLVACSKSGGAAAPGATTTASVPAALLVAAAATQGAAALANAAPVQVLISDVEVAGGASVVHVAWKMPEGTGVNDEAPFRLRWKTSEGLSEPPDDVTSSGASVAAGFDVALKPTKGAASAKLVGLVELVVCDVKTHAVCLPVKRKVEMNFLVGKSTAARVAVALDLPAASTH
jgi:DsbC/DsbD-like thiol-disulfide interchange protein